MKSCSGSGSRITSLSGPFFYYYHQDYVISAERAEREQQVISCRRHDSYCYVHLGEDFVHYGEDLCSQDVGNFRGFYVHFARKNVETILLETAFYINLNKYVH
jgi:hypothetical protein